MRRYALLLSQRLETHIPNPLTFSWVAPSSNRKEGLLRVIHCPLYGIAILPLIKRLNVTETSQKWYADDENSAGELTKLREVFRVLQEDGPNYGHFINGPNCHLITKKNMTEEAKRVFHNTGVQIGLSARVLASVIGDASALNMYCEDKVQKYSKMTEKLRKFARSNPHPVYSCLTKGVQSKLSFMTRTAPEFHLKLDGVENDISEKLIPTLTGRDAPNDTQMELLSLPLRMGGLNIQMPSDYSENFKWSKMNSEPLEKVTPVVAKNIQNRILSDIKIAKERTNKAKLHNIKSKLSEEETYALNLASEKGSLSWLNALLLQRYGFNLTKGGFRDGLCFRYSWETKNTPAKCPCSQKFSLAHALHCPKG